MPPSARHARLAFWLPGLLAIALTLSFFIERGGLHGNKIAAGYYEYLTDALLSGQLHLKVQPDPRLAQVENPWIGFQGIPRLHDATYFEGKYYMYFGATPVVILLGPWKLISGVFLPDEAATALLAALALLASLTLLRRTQLRLFPRLSASWLFVFSTTWVSASFVLYVVNGCSFYAIPTMAACFLIFVALHCLLTALEKEQAPRAILWLGLTSLVWGLVVGARPNLVFGLSGLGIALIALLLQRKQWSTKEKILATTAALTPAACIGLLMALYNYARFHHPLEFGWHYQFAAEDFRHLNPIQPRQFFSTMGNYLLTGGQLSPYYPFVLPGDILMGFLWFCPLGFLAWPLSLSRQNAARTLGNLWVRTIWWVSCVHLAALSLFIHIADRYALDFIPLALFCAFLAVMNIVERSQTWRPALRRTTQAVLLLITLGSAYLEGGLVLGRLPDSTLRRSLERVSAQVHANVTALWGNKPSYTLLRVTPGDLVIGKRYPMLATDGGTDVYYLQRTGADKMQLGFVNRGYDVIAGEEIPFTSGASYEFKVTASSLLPPSFHPFWDGLPADKKYFLGRFLQVTWQDREVLYTSMEFTPNSPWDRQVGKVTPTHSSLESQFMGDVALATAPINSLEEVIKARVPLGALRLRMDLSNFNLVLQHPLISTGHNGAGDLIFLTHLGPGLARIGHDSIGGGGDESGPFQFDPAKPVEIEVDYPALYAPKENGRALLRIRVNGQLVYFRTRPYTRASAFETAVGVNHVRSSTASDRSFAKFFTVEGIAPLRDQLALPSLNVRDTRGIAQLVLQFPNTPLTGAEPVLVSGKTGQGDLIYLVPLGGDLYRLGHDHWAVGAELSEPFKLPPHRFLKISIINRLTTHGSSEGLPSDLQAYAEKGTAVLIDGVIVLRSRFTPYPDEDGLLDIGRNDIGGSSCNPIFSGQILNPEITNQL